MPRSTSVPSSHRTSAALALTIFLAAGTGSAHAAATGVASLRWLNPSPQGNPVSALDFESESIGYAVGGYGTTLRTTDRGETWVSLTDPLIFGITLRDVLVLAPSDLLAVGEGTGVYRSTDGGTSWRSVANPSTAPLSQIERVGTQLSVVGDDGQRIVSIDEGRTWSMAAPTGVTRPRDQAWLDPQHGWVVGEPEVAETTDGGATWSVLSFPFASYADIQFLDGQEGYLASTFELYRTTDAGASWIPTPLGPPGPLYLREQVVYSRDHRFFITDGEGADMWETTDDGATWSVSYARTATVGYSDLVELPSGRLVVSSTDGDLLHSDDQGHTWTNTTLGPGDEDRIALWHVRQSTNGRAFAFGYDEDWLRTEDDGLTWTRESPPNGYGPYELEFWSDGLLGLGSGTGANVAKTTDGGLTWSERVVTSGGFAALAGIEIVDENTIFLAYLGSGAVRVFRSTDGGDTWEPRSNGIPANAEEIRCLSFVDENVGYVAGGWFTAAGHMMKTTDGGANWFSVPTPDLGGSRIWDMHWLTADHGFAGSRYDIWETTDGGTTWASALEAPCWSMAWRGDRGCIVWFGSNVLQITLDGGSTWTSVEVPVSGYFFDATWVDDERLWLSAPGSRLVEVTLLSPSDVPEAETTAPILADWLVSPNPATDRVRIDFNSSYAGIAHLSWFDVGGRRIADDAVSLRESTSSLPATIPPGHAGSVLFLRITLPDGTVGTRPVTVVR
ncbi:MAG: YCF48-related protein [Candidatus Eisenbacteria bacterium]|uniref:Photosynthesis system II assembly factor Ycf48/Hcf136-like domain-containing protein n=1 Tax=Eiseniibacteriota bacterium TaxID=2212470 RepID=A0A956LYN4_UNCEI|nr:hypothetical protein [Candidatus Eisenbacteria bacterium]